MSRRHPRSTRTDTLVPATTLVRSRDCGRRTDERGAAITSDSRSEQAAHACRQRHRQGAPERDADDRPHDRGPARLRAKRPEQHEAQKRNGDDERYQLLSRRGGRSEEHTSELQSLTRTSYAVFSSKNKNYMN